MKKTLQALLFILLFYCSAAFAQSRQVTGTVINAEDGKAIPGATVTEIGNASNSSATDAKGSFTIRISSGRVLRITSLGYMPQQVPITDQTSLTIRLSQQSMQLTDVVITAYGSTKKSAFTGTATTITNDKFKDLQATTISDVLQGNASGVVAISGSGQPGETPTVRIRGIGSVNASSNPLYLVDGAPYSGNISSINPSEIETVTILKDASATSIYGSRAANGIIQITTKRGSGKPKVQFSALTGASQRAVPDYKTLNSGQYMEVYWEALRNDAAADPKLLTQYNAATPEAYASGQLIPRTVYNPYNVAQPVGLNGRLDPNAKLLWADDWLDASTRTGIRSDINLSVSGSDPNNTVRYYISGGTLRDEGVINESEFKRYSGRAKVDATPAKWLRVGVNSSLSVSNQNFPYQGNAGASNQLAFARNIAPIYPIYLRDQVSGNYVLDANGAQVFDFGNNTNVVGQTRPSTQNRPYVLGQNPIATTNINPITNDVVTANGIAYAEVDLFKGLTFRSQYTFNYNQLDGNLFWNPFYGDGATSNGYSYRGITLRYSQNFANTLTYDTNFGKHHLNVLGGTEAYKETSELTSVSATGFTFAAPTQPSYGSTTSGSGTKTFFNLESYFSRLAYDYADKYHLNMSLRTDGSTRFADGNRWGVFYAVGASWNVDREKFMSSVDFLSSLKLKASYGTSGNQALPGDFPYLGTYSAGNTVNNTPGAIVSTVSNFDLSWEKQKQLDAGVEFGFLKDRITGSVVYFDRKSDNLLYQRPLPGSTGLNSISDNVGGIRNYGWEFELNTVNIRTTNFSWRTSFNITKLKNVITEAAPGTTQIVGGSLYDYTLRRYAGVNPANGKPQWFREDPNNPGNIITTETYSQATLYYGGNGSRLSDYTGGLSNTLSYKGFDLSALLSFGLGGKYYDSDYAGLMAGSVGASNISTDIYDRWQSPSQPGNGIVPRLTTVTSNVGTSASTRFLYDATFMRVRNITLGYTVPSLISKKALMSNARIFVDLQNPFTFFGGPTGADPEAGLNAQTGNSNTSAYKTLSIGLNIGF